MSTTSTPHTPSTITAHAPGYIDPRLRDHRRPADRRAAQARDHAERRLAHGGERPPDLRLPGRPEAREDLHRVPQDPQRRRLRRLPPERPGGAQQPHHHRPARRLRPRPHHRRLPPRRPVRRRRADRGQEGRAHRSSTWSAPSRTSSATARRTRSRSARSRELKEMAASYGFDISGPAATAQEAVQWLYFAYLGAVKEQNGAAMSLGRTSTFLDVFLQRDLVAGTLTETEAQEIIDDFVIKLRIVRFLRTPEYDTLFSRRPDVGDRVDRRHRRGRPLARHQDLLPVPADPLQPRPRARAEPHRAVERQSCRGASRSSAPRSRSTPPRSSTSPTS